MDYSSQRPWRCEVPGTDRLSARRTQLQSGARKRIGHVCEGFNNVEEIRHAGGILQKPRCTHRENLTGHLCRNSVKVPTT